MSNTDKNSSEEVDLGLLFKAIGNMFKALFNFITGIFSSLFRLFIFLCKTLIEYYKLLIPILLISFLIGLFKESKSEPLYISKMLVKTYFDSKFQLIDNLDYYNSLIENNNFEELNRVFQIGEEDLESLISFTIQPGLETRNDLLKYYDEYIKEIDTSMTSLINFDQFIKNRELVSGNLFDIAVISKKRDVFKKLEEGLRGSFANNYSIQVKRKRDSVISITIASIESQLAKIEELKKTYISVLEQESKTPNLTLGYSQVPLAEQTSKTKEFELLNKEIELKNKLRTLMEKQIKENEYYEILSSFQEVGSKYSTLTTNFKIIYPLYSFIILIVLFSLWKFINYVKNYE